MTDNEDYVTITGLHSNWHVSWSEIMHDADPQSTFRGLPLTPEQDAEVRHYIKKQKQQGAQWDTPELAAMLHDMLEPPGDDDDEFDPVFDETKDVAERAAASIDESMDPIEASEERQAAMEIEAMKGTKR
ncbi:hypothetical protein GGD70_004178 [Paraburkholderia fungorum]|nr:hypothetical protein [Paraburkholderia fungorum]